MSMAPFSERFLTPDSLPAYRHAMALAVDAVAEAYGVLRPCHSGRSPAEIAAAIARLPVCPEQGQDLATVVDTVAREVLAHSLVVSHPLCVAHLHCPPLLPALAAEAMISAANQSMDSWDQAPAATYLEERLTDWLCERFGYRGGDGIFTSGGTQSNFMGLMLARDALARRVWGWDVQRQGLPPQAAQMRILCSDVAHFSVQQSAALLGLGHAAVVTVATDAAQRMDPQALQAAVDGLLAQGLWPMAIVGTAGTTDHGSIDPLPALADIAQACGAWLHVDAAYGGALILSERHAPRLDGIARADSITVDFHKLFYQPISCGAFLVRERAAFGLMQLNADYLNPEDNAQAGILDLVGKSLQTTRRFDGLKLFMTLNVLGRQGLAEMVDATLDLAAAVAQELMARPGFELAAPPALNALVFRRHDPTLDEAGNDALNARLRERFMAEGSAWLSRTRWRGRTFLKMTLLNPRTTLADVQGLLDRF